MKDRLVVRLLVLGIWLFGVWGNAEGAEKKHVVVLIADDLNCYLGCYGHALAKTPHIDGLAKRGVVFEKAYCQYPVCNASRASVFTGLRPDVTGVRENWTHFRHVVPDAVSLPQMFRRGGYFSARVGKIYHYNVPKEIGMDCMDDPASWDLRYNPIGRDKTDEEKVFTIRTGQYGGTVSWLAAEGTDEEQTDGKGATAAIKILKRFGAEGEKPLFLAFGMFRPHTPYVAPRKYFRMYPLEEIEVLSDAAVAEDWRDVPPAALLSHKKEQERMGERLKKEAIQAYLASITFMDAQVGRVLDALEESGLAKDTMVVMTSDHGYHMGEHGLWQKQSLFENAARVPLIIAAPGAKGNGKMCDSPVELIDLHATLAAWAGIEVPDDGLPRDGQDLMPLLDDPSLPGKGYAITQVYRSRGMAQSGKPGQDAKSFHGYSIRTERYRYNRWDAGEKGEELYDHETDAGELTNLADDPEMAPLKKELGDRLLPFEKAHGAADPLTSGRVLRF